MFVDSPVGTGYSYVDDTSLYCRDLDCMSNDLLTLLKSVFNDYPDMQNMDFYIYSESYGGKAAPGLAQVLVQVCKLL